MLKSSFSIYVDLRYLNLDATGIFLILAVTELNDQSSTRITALIKGLIYSIIPSEIII